MRIKLNAFKPRPYQQALCDAFEEGGYKRLLVVWPRRAGKDLVAWNLLIREAIRKVAVYMYCLPTYKQCKLVLWSSITNDGKSFLDYIDPSLIESKNESELRIKLVNGSIIQLIGSDSYNTSLVGSNARMIIFSEFALSDPESLKFARPIVNANDGILMVLSTPRGKNYFYDLFNIASASKEWFCQLLTLDDTKHISRETINAEVESGQMSQGMADQEYDCSFERGQAGSVYGKEIDKLRLGGNITTVPWNPSLRTHTFWDLGVRDATSIIMAQVQGSQVNIIDCYENTGHGLSHYVKYLESLPYIWGKHVAPFDIKVRELGTGMSRLEKARQLGISFIVAPSLSKEDGIEAVRATLPRMSFDEVKCRTLIKAMENYHYEYDTKRNVYSTQPVHDSSSNFCDAMRYLCITLPRTADGLTSEQIDRNYREAMYGGEANMPSPFQQPNHYV